MDFAGKTKAQFATAGRRGGAAAGSAAGAPVKGLHGGGREGEGGWENENWKDLVDRQHVRDTIMQQQTMHTRVHCLGPIAGPSPV